MPSQLEAQVASMQQIIQNMATQHVVFGVVGSDEKVHPDWCPLCRIEKAEEIGSPDAIARWIEETVIPILGVQMGLPEVSVAKGIVQQGASAGDLIEAIRTTQVVP